jgi:Surface antigen variable number repeat
MRIVATVLTGLLGVAMATWGTIQLTPRDLQAGVAATVATTVAPRSAGGPVVRSIRFVGDLDPLAARGAMRTRVGAAVDAGDLAADRAVIEARLVVDGHLDASVQTEGDVDVVFRVGAGPVYRLGAVRLVGNLVKKYPAMGDELTVAAGDEFSARAIERTQERLATWLTVHGVSRVQVTHELAIDRDAKRVDVVYDAELRPAIARR